MYGCRLAISRIDAEYLKKELEEGRISSKLYPLAGVPEFDILLEDGETVELGNVKIRCMHTPGHNVGVMSFFFEASYEGKTYSVGLFGGAGTNALTLKYIYKKNLPRDCAEQMLESIEKLRGERVEIHLGNHPGNNHTLERREKQMLEGGNPFIDESSWGEFLDSLEKKVHTIIDENQRLEAELDSRFPE
jgi:metallo-beta-lactamase class B